MKKLPLLLSVIVLSGCSTWPKDSYVKDAEVTTPWGHTSASVIATGAAAKNLTEEERKSILTPTPRK